MQFPISLKGHMINAAFATSCFSLTLLLVTPLGEAQTLADHGEIQRANGVVRVTAMGARTLLEALNALRVECGWTIDYEDPDYVSEDFVDATDPRWRAANPHEPGVRRARGASFTTPFVEAQGSTVDGEERVLKSIVEDYNRSEEPGLFEVRREDGRLAVVGMGSKRHHTGSTDRFALLDVPVTLPVKDRTGVDAVTDILAAVSVQTGHKAIPFFLPLNVMPPMVNIGGGGVPASQLLTNVLQQTRPNLYWDLLFDPDLNCYVLNLLPTRKGLKLVPKQQ